VKFIELPDGGNTFELKVNDFVEFDIFPAAVGVFHQQLQFCSLHWQAKAVNNHK
jgi:hypothetical protein